MILAFFKKMIRRHRINKFFHTEHAGCSVTADFDEWGRVTYYEINYDSDD